MSNRASHRPGGNDKNGGKGGMKVHERLYDLVDQSPDFATDRHKLQIWADERLPGGASALPRGLRP